MIFELARERKFTGEHIKTIECLCLGTIGLIVAPWKFDVLKTSMRIFSHKGSPVLRKCSFREAII